MIVVYSNYSWNLMFLFFFSFCLFVFYEIPSMFKVDSTQSERAPSFSQKVWVWSYPGSGCQKTWCVVVSCVLVLSWPVDLNPGIGLNELVLSETELRFLQKYRQAFMLLEKSPTRAYTRLFISYLLHMTRNMLPTVSAHMLSHILSGLRGTYLSLQV